jgi:hypothetical protein
MSDLTLSKTSLIAGVWQGILTGKFDGEGAPAIKVTHLDQSLSGVEVAQSNGQWVVRVPIPADLISDGVQSFIISDAKSGTTLDSFAVLAGEALAEDIRAEMDLLRAELDMLKRAFRRHCVETT